MAQRTIAEERQQEAERNFAAAKQGASSLVLEIARALRGQEGMRTETVRKTLGIAHRASWSKNRKTTQSSCICQATMLNEFARTYAAQDDMTKANEAARNEIAIAERLATTQAMPAGGIFFPLLTTSSATYFKP